ncbi:uncharacterized protein PAC_14675 [Phialocephala subalpina]|uniref:BRCT domain-containing protein n=1 Tax=Phialocephala subalpina TaxID=576137 RepID=A0A1L7XIJ5_9HELO|nr:uncharacterized protein PAC_14675 [Phialocephala subalpina]
MAVVLHAGHCYLVHRTDYGSHDETSHISEIFGCYTTFLEATRRAKAEVRSLALECDLDATVRVDGGYNNIERAVIGVEQIACESKYYGDGDDSEEEDDEGREGSDAMSVEETQESVQEESAPEEEEEEEEKQEDGKDEDENLLDAETPEILSQPPPAPATGQLQWRSTNPTTIGELPLPIGTVSCLSQQVFALAGTQKPHSRAAINNLIRQYGGSVVPLLPVRNEIQFVVLGDDIDDVILSGLRN